MMYCTARFMYRTQHLLLTQIIFTRETLSSANIEIGFIVLHFIHFSLNWIQLNLCQHYSTWSVSSIGSRINLWVISLVKGDRRNHTIVPAAMWHFECGPKVSNIPPQQHSSRIAIQYHVPVCFCIQFSYKSPLC